MRGFRRCCLGDDRAHANSGLSSSCFYPGLPEAPDVSGADWVHEIQHDGFRPIARRDGAVVRLIAPNGHDFSERYPAVANAVNPCTSARLRGVAGSAAARSKAIPVIAITALTSRTRHNTRMALGAPLKQGV